MYKEKFRPSATLAEPKASVGIFAFCSEDPKKAQEIQALVDYRLLGFEKGRYDEIPTVAAATAYEYTPAEYQRVLYNRQRTAIGTPEQLRAKLATIATDFGVDEIVISTFTETAEDRFHSYELLADLFALRPREIPTLGEHLQSQ
ncbi:MAG TPA: hypothetical protein VGS79_17555 [Puia sp.]|nr:hypothetical protein [Puia sp.]